VSGRVLRDVFSALEIIGTVDFPDLTESAVVAGLHAALTAFKHKDFDTAIEWLRCVVPLTVISKQQCDAFFLLALCLFSIGQPLEAGVEAERALSVDADHFGATILLLLSSVESGNEVIANQLLARVRLLPEFVSSALGLEHALHASGRFRWTLVLGDPFTSPPDGMKDVAVSSASVAQSFHIARSRVQLAVALRVPVRQIVLLIDAFVDLLRCHVGDRELEEARCVVQFGCARAEELRVEGMPLAAARILGAIERLQALSAPPVERAMVAAHTAALLAESLNLLQEDLALKIRGQASLFVALSRNLLQNRKTDNTVRLLEDENAFWTQKALQTSSLLWIIESKLCHQHSLRDLIQKVSIGVAEGEHLPLLAMAKAAPNEPWSTELIMCCLQFSTQGKMQDHLHQNAAVR